MYPNLNYNIFFKVRGKKPTTKLLKILCPLEVPKMLEMQMSGFLYSECLITIIEW